MVYEGLHNQIAEAVAAYVRVAPNSHLGDTPEEEDREHAFRVIYSHPEGVMAGLAALQRDTSSMEDM